MQNKINAHISSQDMGGKAAWKSPTISYIDIKRTMSTPGGSLSDAQFNSPGGSLTTAN
jgi:hypothetical protein